jgi:hypothetical protein
VNEDIIDDLALKYSFPTEIYLKQQMIEDGAKGRLNILDYTWYVLSAQCQSNWCKGG